ncbi:DUF1145 domain-containing protein [uncultured Shewanella sp.]|uniref:DUF1145 domain-containing protein n=1 Tax=Shewanella atlantica TaxID=271099 RepID=UPI002607C43C|nr:DUF1145 domain-containing protein [uncultured Shewanella sp.]
MKFVITTGKAVTLFAWLLMAYNLIMPFEGNIGIILYILLAITAFMHLFQVVIFHTLFKSLLTLKRSDYLHVFTFGAFSLLQYRSKVMQNLGNAKTR